MLRPISATLRPNSAEMSRIICMRWIDELKQDITIRRSARLKISSSRGRTARSRFGVSGPVHIGGVGEQQQHAALAVIGEGMQIERLVVERSGIDLVIARMDHYAQRRRDGERQAVHHRVRDVDELHFERAGFHDLSRALTARSCGSCSSSCSSRRRSTSASVNGEP